MSDTVGARQPIAAIPLVAEDVVIARRVVEGDTVRVATVTREREHLVDEVVLKEQVEITHVPIGREITTAPPIRQEGDLTIIPVVHEELVVTRKLILKEEIHVRRTGNPARHQETVVLRAQEAVVNRVPPDATLTTNDFNLNQGDKS